MAEEILIRINLQSGEAKSKIDGVKKSTSKLAQEKKKLLDLQKREAIEIAKLQEQQKIQREINTKLAQSELGVGQAINRTTAALKTGRAQSGLNNAILLETSRLASDASFGFTAIANNLSQVINLFTSFAQTNGGVIKSLKELGKSIIGTGGLLIGVQLLISFGPKLFKFFKELITGFDTLEDAFKKAGEGVATQAGNFDIYIDKLQDSTESQEQQEIALKKLKKEFPDFISNIKEAGVNLEDIKDKTAGATEEIDNFRESLVELAMSEAAIDKIREIAGERIQVLVDRQRLLIENNFDSIEQVEEIVAASKKQAKQFTEDGFAIAQSNTLQSTTQDTRLEKAQEILDFEKEQLEELDARILLLQQFVKLDDKSTKDGAKNARIRTQFRAGDLDFEKEIIKSQERALAGFIKTEETKIIQAGANRMQLAKLRLDDFKERENERLKEKVAKIKERLDDDKLSAEERANGLRKIKEFTKKKNDALKEAEVSFNNFIVQVGEETNARLDQVANERARRAREITEEAAAIRENFELETDLRSIKIEGKRNEVRMMRDFNALESERKAINKRLSLGGLEVDKKAELELQKTKVEEEQAKIRIAIADAEANAKIQGLDVTANALSAFSKLAGEETKTGKFLSIASALISTYLSAQKAFESQFLPIPTKSSPIRGAIAAAAAIASGIANVKAITSVNEKGQSGTGGATQRPSITATAPDFNVVGASQASQLAQSISTQVEKPVKAFVVGKEITSQQELDRNINNTAGI